MNRIREASLRSCARQFRRSPAMPRRGAISAFSRRARKCQGNLSNAAQDEERKNSRRAGAPALKYLELAEANPNDPVAVEALGQTVACTNGSAFPPGGKDTPPAGTGALAARSCPQRQARTGLPSCPLRDSPEPRGVPAHGIGSNPTPRGSGAACLSLAHFLHNRLHRLEVLQDHDQAALARYHKVLAKILEELQRQDRAAVVREVETLFARAAEKFADVKFRSPTMASRHGRRKAEGALFQNSATLPSAARRRIEGIDQYGTRFKLSDYRGKVVLLDFWNRL